MIVALLFSILTAQAYTIEELPIQDGGRTKPFLTYAEETLTLIHGSKKFEKQPAMRIMATWLLVPEIWDEKPLIKIDHHGLKETLGFEKTKKYFSLKELMNHQRLNTLFADVNSRAERKEKLTPYFQAVQRLEFQILTFMGLRRGAVGVFPSSDPEKSTAWQAIAELDDARKDQFFKILSSYAGTFTAADEAKKIESATELNTQLADFTQAAQTASPSEYPSEKSMKMEVHYQKLHPFMITWILYLISALLFSLSLIFLPQIFSFAGGFAMCLAFAMHTYGFALRIMITGRPPVSNMYESVIWVAWGTVLFAGLFYLLQMRKKYLLIAGCAVATICMVVADRAPVILDPSLQPLEPVLRSNMWLIIHVMTITLSYAAFFLALGVGDYGLFIIVRDSAGNKTRIRELSQICYRLIQVGVVLLAAGTILGGVWADYSWGRFWGWDPKETWAFIALMGYLALLHARLTGWVKEFGLLAGSVISFSLVIMAWYGVNYILGTGLHSYGFGAGGLEYVGSFVGLHLVFVGYSWFLFQSAPGSGKPA